MNDPNTSTNPSAVTPRQFEPLSTWLPKNTSFSANSFGVQLAWDSTSMGALKKCPRYYHYTVMRGLRSNHESPHLTFGIGMHRALEHYDKARAAGTEHETAIRDTVKAEMIRTWGWASDHTAKNRETFIRAIVWYLDHFGESDPAVTVSINGVPAVELSFRIKSDIDTGGGFPEPILLCGHLDKIVDFGGQKWVLDRKTTGSTISTQWFDSFTPDPQFSQYAFAGAVGFEYPVAGVIVDGIQCAVGFNRFQRGFAPRPKAIIEEWYADTMYWIRLAQSFAEASHWPMNDKSCSMYGGCAFRSICAKPPSVREDFLQANFHQVQWDPMIPR